MLPSEVGFGRDDTYNYAQVRYLNQNSEWVEREIETPIGDYEKIYDAVYETVINNELKLITDEEILTVIEILSY